MTGLLPLLLVAAVAAGLGPVASFFALVLGPFILSSDSLRGETASPNMVSYESIALAADAKVAVAAAFIPFFLLGEVLFFTRVFYESLITGGRITGKSIFSNSTLSISKSYFARCWTSSFIFSI